MGMACGAAFIFPIRWDRVRADTKCDCRALPASVLIFLIFSPGSLSSNLVELTVNPRNSISWVGVSSDLEWLITKTPDSLAGI